MLTSNRDAIQILNSFIMPRIREQSQRAIRVAESYLYWMPDRTLSLVDRSILFYLQPQGTEQKYMAVDRLETGDETRSGTILRCQWPGDLGSLALGSHLR